MVEINSLLLLPESVFVFDKSEDCLTDCESCPFSDGECLFDKSNCSLNITKPEVKNNGHLTCKTICSFGNDCDGLDDCVKGF